MSSDHSNASGTALGLTACVAALGALILCTDLWLRDTPGSPGLCVTAGCRLAGQSLRLGDIPLLVAGVLFFALTALMAILTRQKSGSPLWRQLLTMLVFGGLAFDGTLLGYQFLVLQTACQVCVGVAGALFLILILLALNRHSWRLFIKGLGIWAGAASAIFFLALTPPTPDQAATIQFTSGNATQPFPRYHLYYSNNCDQCESLLMILALVNPKTSSWDISCVDTDDKHLAQLTPTWNQRHTLTNIFAALLAAKQSPSSLPVPNDLRHKAEKARTWIVNKDYTGVPLLVVTLDTYQHTILQGKASILDYLGKKQVFNKGNNPLVELLSGSPPPKAAHTP